MAIYALNSKNRWHGTPPFDGDFKILDTRFTSFAGPIEDFVKEVKERLIEMSRDMLTSPEFGYTMESVTLTRVESEHTQLVDEVDGLLKQIPRIITHVYSVTRERPQPLATHMERNQLATFHELLKQLRKELVALIVRYQENPDYSMSAAKELAVLLAEGRETRLIKEYERTELPEPYDWANMDCEDGICADLGWKPFGDGMTLIAMSSYCQEVQPERFLVDISALDLSDDALTAIVDNLRKDGIFLAREAQGLALYYAPCDNVDFYH